MSDDDVMEDDSSIPCLTVGKEEEEPLRRILRTATALVLGYPAVMQSVFRALVEEGRHFAETEEGQRWRDALAGSDLVRHGRAIWEASSFQMLEDAPVVFPSAVVDTMVYAATQPDVYEKLPGLLSNPED